jgi:putative phage-type endonuclease
MATTYHNVEQGSDEWHALRCGILTASEIKHIITEKTLKPSNNEKTRAHVYEIAAQRISGYTEPQYISDDMLRGMADEILAIELYSEKYRHVDQVGFVTNNDLGFVIGYSPDGLIGRKEGLVEIKSRSQKYQVQTIANDEVPSEYMLQLQTGLFVTGREWLDFISYCGGLPMYVKRAYPDPTYIDAIKEAAIAFEQEVNAVVDRYKENSKGLQQTKRNDDFDIL